MLLKVCGVCGPEAERDIEMLAAADVDLVGLWHGVPGGEAELTDAELVHLAAVAREGGVEPVMVTFESDAPSLARALTISGVTWVQLHAFQLPHVVTELRAAMRHSRVTIVKVLHVRGERCVDLRLAAAYERAGVDAFLLDVAMADGRLGSTGAAIPPAVASEVAARLNRPFFLAGGLNARSRPAYQEVTRDEGFVGIDVSTGARDERGRLRMRRVEAVGRAWRGGPVEGGCLTSLTLS
jgi:phosphoribosylanthranilate isomerase